MPGVPNLPSTTEEIEAIYAAGPAAVVAFVQQFVEQLNIALRANAELAQRNAELAQRNAELAQRNAELAQRITELEERLGRNSRNSNQPPSSDGFNRPPRPSPRSLRQPTDKKTGGQPGHKGKTLPFSANPDRVVVHRPVECAE